jgi:hypothetical protein
LASNPRFADEELGFSDLVRAMFAMS